MSIQFTKAYVANGKTFASLVEAQLAAMEDLLSKTVDPSYSKNAAVAILQNSEKVIDILTVTDKSRPTARKINGGTKKRKAKAGAEPETHAELGPQ